MAVWCMAALALLFYTAAVPLKLALVVRIATRSGFGLGLAPFENRFALRSAIQRAAGKKKRLLKKHESADIEKAAYVCGILTADGDTIYSEILSLKQYILYAGDFNRRICAAAV